MRGLHPKKLSAAPSKKPRDASRQMKSGRDTPPPHDPFPFDAAFFRTHFPHLVLKCKKAPTPASRDGRDYVVNVVLGDGSITLDVSHIESLSEYWILIAAFDDSAVIGINGMVCATRYLFVPYGAISRIEVVALERHASAIGFGEPWNRKRPRRRRSRRDRAAGKNGQRRSR